MSDHAPGKFSRRELIAGTAVAAAGYVMGDAAAAPASRAANNQPPASYATAVASGDKRMQPGAISSKEAHLVETDPNTGSKVFRLTSFPCVHHDIYCEVPYVDVDSRYVIYMQTYRPYGSQEVWRADLQSLRLAMVHPSAVGTAGAAVTPGQRWFFHHSSEPHRAIVRTDIATLEQDTFRFDDLPMPRSTGSVSPDGRFCYQGGQVDGEFSVIEVDLEKGDWRVIDQDPGIFNPHLQVEPGRGRYLMVQQSRGAILDDHGAIVQRSDERGITLYLIDLRTHRRVTLPVGPPDTWRCQGHQCWIGDTGEILFTISEGLPGISEQEQERRRDKLVREGNLLAIAPGDEKPRVVAGGYRFVHPNASRDGRFFVVDTPTPRRTLVVGSIRTGRTAELCHSRTQFCGMQPSHPHPYFTPDRKWVIFNSDAIGSAQLHAATVPEGLLESLE